MSFPYRPNGAWDCSHGWSEPSAQPTAAQPVETGARFLLAPEGRRN